MKLFSNRMAGVALVIWLVSSCLFPAFARVVDISVVNYRFVPATTNISVNDQVIWTWPSGSFNHNVTSTSSPQAWPASPTKNGPFTFTNTFTAAGTYPYECTIHASIGMKGTITVTGPNLPPTVTLTNPASGSVFAAPANVTLQASATDSDGSVTNVRFLIGSTVLTNQTVSPFSTVASNLTAGDYPLTVIATDNAGSTATNSVNISVVNPVPLTLSGAAMSGLTNFRFSYAANVGLNYVVSRSTNLVLGNWIPLATNTAASNPVIFIDVVATNQPAFYRVGRLPNP